MQLAPGLEKASPQLYAVLPKLSLTTDQHYIIIFKNANQQALHQREYHHLKMFYTVFLQAKNHFVSMIRLCKTESLVVVQADIAKACFVL